jgi:magnesium transporter
MPVFRDIEQNTESIEDHVLAGRAEDSAALLRRIGRCSKKITALMHVLIATGDTVKNFANCLRELHSVSGRDSDFSLYVSDIQDRNVGMISDLDHLEMMLAHAQSNCLAQLGLSSVMKGNGVKRAVITITLIATLLTPLNVICSAFGMNVFVPGKDSRGLGWFFGVIGMLVAFVVVCLAFAKRMKCI